MSIIAMILGWKAKVKPTELDRTMAGLKKAMEFKAEYHALQKPIFQPPLLRKDELEAIMGMTEGVCKTLTEIKRKKIQLQSDVRVVPFTEASFDQPKLCMCYRYIDEMQPWPGFHDQQRERCPVHGKPDIDNSFHPNETI